MTVPCLITTFSREDGGDLCTPPPPIDIVPRKKLLSIQPSGSVTSKQEMPPKHTNDMLALYVEIGLDYYLDLLAL